MSYKIASALSCLGRVLQFRTHGGKYLFASLQITPYAEEEFFVRREGGGRDLVRTSRAVCDEAARVVKVDIPIGVYLLTLLS